MENDSEVAPAKKPGSHGIVRADGVKDGEPVRWVGPERDRHVGASDEPLQRIHDSDVGNDVEKLPEGVPPPAAGILLGQRRATVHQGGG